MAPTRTNPIIFYLIRTGPKHFIINPKLPGFRLQQTCEYDQILSNNILQHANQCPILAVLTQVGNARHGFHLIFHFIFKILRKNIYTLAKTPGPDQTKIFIPDPARPENILKNMSRSRTGFSPVQSGPWKLGGEGVCVSGCPAGLYFEGINKV